MPSFSGSFDALNFNKEFQLPQVGDHDVLVKFHAASLNYRDLIIPLVSPLLRILSRPYIRVLLKSDIFD